MIIIIQIRNDSNDIKCFKTHFLDFLQPYLSVVGAIPKSFMQHAGGGAPATKCHWKDMCGSSRCLGKTGQPWRVQVGDGLVQRGRNPTVHSVQTTVCFSHILMRINLKNLHFLFAQFRTLFHPSLQEETWRKTKFIVKNFSFSISCGWSPIGQEPVTQRSDPSWDQESHV